MKEAATEHNTRVHATTHARTGCYNDTTTHVHMHVAIILQLGSTFGFVMLTSLVTMQLFPSVQSGNKTFSLIIIFAKVNYMYMCNRSVKLENILENIFQPQTNAP